MPTATANVAQAQIKLNGSVIEAAVMDSLHLVEVDASLHLPAAATIELYDSKLKWVDDTRFVIGAGLEILMLANSSARNPQYAQIFDGVVAAIEPYYPANQAYCIFVMRAYDRSYLLHRGTASKTFLNMSDSDIVSQIAGEAGLQAQVTATSKIWDHVFRGDLSDYDFIKLLAARNGYLAFCDARKFVFKPPADLGGAEITVEHGADLIEFRPTLSMSGQVNEVQIGGWDRKQKAAVSGAASSPAFGPTETSFSRGGALMTNAHGAKVFHNMYALDAQADADKEAQALLDRYAANDLTGEGTARGEPTLKPGCKVNVTNVGTRFSGKYLVTRTRHRLEQETGYTTDFWIGGMQSGTTANLLGVPREGTTGGKPSIPGLVTGIVTNSKDPDALGRVKLKFPQLADNEESNWAPVIGAGGGKDRGFLVLPEVNDEVLVGFAYGDLNHPYVLGGLWNGKDKLPDTPVTGSTVDIRIFKTRAGHILRFTDTSGSEKIELIDKTTNNLFTIDSASGDVTIKAAGNITIEATGDIKMKGANVKVEGQGNVEAKASGQMNLKAATIDVAGQGMAKISAAVVQIN